MTPLDLRSLFSLTDPQLEAASEHECDLIVTAGAGSGKTRTLVARYIGLLAEVGSPTPLVAITFTEKAAREMRSRVRTELDKLRREAGDPQEAAHWAALESSMDSARIGTIHSLCAEILRSHPAQAGLDPQFEVLDEAQAAALRAQVVQDVLAWCVANVEMRPLLENFAVERLGGLVRFALQNRLEVAGWLAEAEQSEADSSEMPGAALLRRAVQDFLDSPQVSSIIDEFTRLREAGRLVGAAGEKLALQVANLLQGWSECQARLAGGDLPAALETLLRLRKGGMDLRTGRGSAVYQDLKQLRQAYDEQIAGWLRDAPDAQLEAACASASDALRQLFAYSLDLYRARLDERRALDFDGLEAGALRLLETYPSVRSRWQGQVHSLLVDEFQDTNARQRRIVEAIAGDQPGRLFVVGDERQSIYRFRGAQVTVFRQMRERIEGRGGRAVLIQRTFRAHQDLLQATSALLEPAMTAPQDPPPAFWVPFSPLEPHRLVARPGIQPPHVEFLIGAGRDAGEGRALAAEALARRLIELHGQGQMNGWEQVALLFRASTAFPVYEQAFEKAGIPYVTVAGGGFYERPEIRDVLNLLRALADPWDDLALAGLLRSPAFGLPDSSLYRLRRAGNGGDLQPLYAALGGDLGALPAAEQAIARRALATLRELSPWADRTPVGELLKRLLDATDYRAILAAPRTEGQGASSRLWRNLDKLLEDAYASRLVNLRAFLEYLQTLRDVGAREGEASQEVSGALQLMTVHKSKGLEFDLVVMADAGYGGSNVSSPVYLLPEAGLAFKPDRFETAPLFYSYLKWQDSRQETAEERRLLYVAATRAREKLLVSGHISGKSPRGWLKELLEIVGVPPAELIARPGQWQHAQPHGGQTIGLCAWTESALAGRHAAAPQARPLPDEPHLGRGLPLYHNLEAVQSAAQVERSQEWEPAQPDSAAEELERSWRASGGRHAPSVVVGSLVHRALQRWRFPGDPGLDPLLESAALGAGLVVAAQRADALRQAKKLLDRLREHPLWREVDAALQRHSEVPYARPRDGRVDWGYIDLLYRTPAGWNLVDFKTDELRDDQALARAVHLFQPQLARYAQAARALLGSLASCRACFLDYQGRIEIVNFPCT